MQRGTDFQFDVDNVLGTGFVVDGALVATCDHVLPVEDRDLNIAFFCNDGVSCWLVSLVNIGSIKRWGNEDLIVFQCLDLRGKVQKGLRPLELSAKKLLLAEKVIALGMPKDHMVMNSIGNNNLKIRAIVGHVVTTYERTAEIAVPLIRGMSGGPVLSDSGEVVGIAIENKRVALDLEMVTQESTSDGVIKKEYSYGEYQRFGCFYHSSAFHVWLKDIIHKF